MLKNAKKISQFTNQFFFVLLHSEMKTFSKIIISLTVLILLMFGTGGVCIAKCNCSGKTSLVLPLERSCCPTDGDCMTITVAQISDYEAPTAGAPFPSFTGARVPPWAFSRFFNSHRFHGFHRLFHLTVNMLHNRAETVASQFHQHIIARGNAGATNDPTSIVGTIVLRI
jgi:hypothetical protein